MNSELVVTSQCENVVLVWVEVELAPARHHLSNPCWLSAPFRPFFISLPVPCIYHFSLIPISIFSLLSFSLPLLLVLSLGLYEVLDKRDKAFCSLSLSSHPSTPCSLLLLLPDRVKRERGGGRECLSFYLTISPFLWHLRLWYSSSSCDTESGKCCRMVISKQMPHSSSSHLWFCPPARPHWRHVFHWLSRRSSSRCWPVCTGT